jgi:hypothetical protein
MYVNDLFTAKVEGALEGSLSNAAFIFHFDPLYLEYQAKKTSGIFPLEIANMPAGTNNIIACGFENTTIQNQLIKFLTVNFKALKAGSTRLYLDTVEMKFNATEIEKLVNDKTFAIDSPPPPNVNRIVIDINIYEYEPMTTSTKSFLKKLF